MAELIKQWNDGGSLTATYDGSGDGEAVFTSDAYEGIDREMAVTFKGGGVEVERVVRQEGMRQPIGLVGGGIFRLSNGGRFGVLKGASSLPYAEELSYLETADKQWIDTGVEAPLVAEVRLQGINGNSNTHIVLSTDGSSSGARWFGFKKVWTIGTTAYDFENNYNEIIDASCVYTENGITVTIDDVTKTRTGSQKGNLFIGSPVSNYIAFCRIFSAKIYKDDNLVRDFIPVLDKSNIACMYDKVSGQLFYNQGDGEFLYGIKN